MGRKLGKYSKLLFKLFLLIQLYCYHNLEVVAVTPRQENLETRNDLLHQNETHFDEETGKGLQRTKRPARMIPAHYMFQNEKNGTKKENLTDSKRFYGPASTCLDISKLGYTLNGYYLVKGKNQTINDQVEVIDCRYKHPDGSKRAMEGKIGFINIEIIKSNKSVKRRSQETNLRTSIESNENSGNDRPERPARLLPLRMIHGKPKNITENESEKLFYGPASSCEELGKLGYTLNGLYLVDCKDKSKKGKIELIECRFKQPYGSKEAKEERIGFVNIEAKKAKTVKRRYLNDLMGTRSLRIIQRPARLLPLQLLYRKDKNGTEENQVIVERFYGPPDSCSDLKKLGYTLNGYYLVNGASAGLASRKTRQLPKASSKSTTKRPVIDTLKTQQKGSAQDVPHSRISSNAELNGAGSSRQIEISFCKFHQPLGATESFKEERFILSPKTNFKEERIVLSTKASKPFKFVPLDHGRSESYPIMNLESGKCLDSDDKLTLVIEKDCNPSTAKRWKLVKDGANQLICEDGNFAYFKKCIFRPIRSTALTLLPVTGLFKTHVSVVENQIRFLSKTSQMNATEHLPCAAATNTPDPALPTTVTVQDCNDNYKNQTWSFVSFK